MLNLKESSDARRSEDTAFAALQHMQHALDKLTQHPVIMVPGKVPQLMVPGDTPVRVMFDMGTLRYLVAPYINSRTAPDTPIEVLERHALYARAFEAMLNKMPPAEMPPTKRGGGPLLQRIGIWLMGATFVSALFAFYAVLS
jgi:hypothetical protein